jgi:hypothetical protein
LVEEAEARVTCESTRRDCIGPSPNWRTERRKHTGTLGAADRDCGASREARNSSRILTPTSRRKCRPPRANCYRCCRPIRKHRFPQAARAHARGLQDADRQDRAEIRRLPEKGVV